MKCFKCLLGGSTVFIKGESAFVECVHNWHGEIGLCSYALWVRDRIQFNEAVVRCLLIK